MYIQDYQKPTSSAAPSSVMTFPNKEAIAMMEKMHSYQKTSASEPIKAQKSNMGDELLIILLLLLLG